MQELGEAKGFSITGERSFDENFEWRELSEVLLYAPPPGYQEGLGSTSPG
jgi:hypothetical protein